MDRRRFLGVAGAATAAGFVLPAWLARAFGQDHGTQIEAPPQPPPPESTTNVATLSAAYRDAQRLGKPLLVIVVPATEGESAWNRAMALGELLNHGSDEALADLAMTHVVCAKMTDLRQLVPQAPAGEPLLVLVEPDHVPATARAIDPTLRFASPQDSFDSRGGSWEQRQHRADGVIDARLRLLSTALHQAIAPDVAMLTARANVARAHLDAPTLAAVDRAARGGAALDAATADRAAAVVALAAATAPAAVQHGLRASLVAGTNSRLKTQRVPGSMWANGGGCGTTIEGVEDNVMMGCGMGFMPERSSRFLYFYSRVNW